MNKISIIKELFKANKYNDKLIKDLKYKISNKNKQYKINNQVKQDFHYANKTIANDKIIHYENFLNIKNKFNKNLKKQISVLTEYNNVKNYKHNINSNFKNESSEVKDTKIKSISTVDNDKYIFKDELKLNDDEFNNKLIKNETSINVNNDSNIFNKRKINNDKFKEKIINISNNKAYENTKDKILNDTKKGNKIHIDLNNKKIKRKGHSAKNIFKAKNKNFEFDDENNKLTSYFLFNLQREKMLNNKNTFESLTKKINKM